MKKAIDKRILLAAAAVVVLIALLLVLPMPGSSEGTDGDKLVVAVSIVPQAGFVEAIGGDRVQVVVMLPPGYSAHSYIEDPHLMGQLSRAQVYFKVGTPIEFELMGLDKLRAQNPNMRLVDCSEGIQIIEMGEHVCDHDHDHEDHHKDDHDHQHDDDGEHHHDDDEHHNDHEHEHEHDHDHVHTGRDPHIWLSVSNAKVMVQNICAALVEVDPDNGAYYEQNCADYLAELRQLDDEIKDALADVENGRFIVYHPAWGYFAHDYDLIQMAVERGGTEPGGQDMERLIDEAREHDIRVVFVSPQYHTKKPETIAREIGGEVVIIDPLAKDFIDNMLDVAYKMKGAMQ